METKNTSCLPEPIVGRDWRETGATPRILKPGTERPRDGSRATPPSPEWHEEVRILDSPERERFVPAHALLVRSIAQRILLRLPSLDRARGPRQRRRRRAHRGDRAVRPRSAGCGSIVRGVADPGRDPRLPPRADVASRSLRRKLRDLDSAAQRAERGSGARPRTRTSPRSWASIRRTYRICGAIGRRRGSSRRTRA